MKIVDILCEPVRSGFYLDDQAAIRAGAGQDGFFYEGTPRTSGFRTIRKPGTAVSVMLLLEDGQVALGDCAEVQYGGAGGRSPLFDAEEAIEEIRSYVAPILIGSSARDFRPLAEEVDRQVVGNRTLGTAVRYGVTQALLHASALTSKLTMAEVVQREYDTGVAIAPVPLYAQSGDERRLNVDKMILKEVDVLPHGLINQIDTKLGRDGGLLKEYVGWIRERILTRRSGEHYAPRLHIDAYGTIGIIFGHNFGKIVDYLEELAEAAKPFRLRLEHPLDAGGVDEQIDAYVRLRGELAARHIEVDLVVDEWCNTLEDIERFVAARAADVIHVKTPDLGGINNTIEALLHVRNNGLAAFCGGTCNETDISARVSTHIAMACGADQVLAKPGMGVDEGLMIVGNEMARTSALVRGRSRSGTAMQKEGAA